jgi:hypothetical protein
MTGIGGEKPASAPERRIVLADLPGEGISNILCWSWVVD